MEGKSTIHLISASFLVCCIQMLTACDRAESRWNETVELNTPEAYRQYAISYPTTPHLMTAHGKFLGHSIMLSKDGSLRTGLFGNEPPEFEIRSESRPDFAFKMSVGDASEAGLLKDGRLDLAASYTYTDSEAIVMVTPRDSVTNYTMVYFKCALSTSTPDDGHVRSSDAKTLGVSLSGKQGRTE